MSVSDILTVDLLDFLLQKCKIVISINKNSFRTIDMLRHLIRIDFFDGTLSKVEENLPFAT